MGELIHERVIKRCFKAMGQRLQIVQDPEALTNRAHMGRSRIGVHRHQVGEHRAGQKLRALHHKGDVALNQISVELAIVQAIEQQRTTGERIQLIDHPQHRGLAAARLAGEGQDLSRFHRQ